MHTTINLRKHQLEGINFLIQHHGGLLADEMGTGKTILSLAFAKWCLYMGLIDRILVVAPPALVTNWVNEIKKYYGFEPSVYHKSKRLSDNWIAITTYSMLRYNKKNEYVHYNNVVKFYRNARLLVILDEAHEIKNSESQTALVCYNLPAEIRIAMTGTPISNKPEDLYGLLHFIDPTIEKSWFFHTFIRTTYKDIQIRNKKTNRVFTRTIPQVTGYKNQDQLNKLLATRMIRRMLKDCVDLPPLNIIYLPYDISDNRMYTQCVNLCDVNDETLMVKIIRLQEAASGLNPWDETKKHFLETEKFFILLSLLESTVGRVVVWFKHYEVLRHVSQILREKGYDIYEWHGRNSNSRDKQRVHWASSQRGIFLATIRAAGVGLNLVEGQTAIFFEEELSPSAVAQAQKRIYRDGQRGSCTIYHLYGRNSVEEAIINLLKKKAHLNSVVTDSFTPEDLQQIYRYSFNLEY